ncbi:MAG TPA: penicillin-binding transpeptidase domain-containing protein [Candidatus Binatia bacterium]|nr:penicillin-binding transpeptidase domain-containing protein [Candidatus Binatia bacterium]
MTAPRGRRARVVVVAALLSLSFALLFARAIDLAVLRGPEFERQAAGQHRKEVALVPHRGEIVDRHGDLLALSLDVPSVYVRPRQLGNDRARLAEVARALHMSAPRVQRIRSQPFVWLKRQALPRELDAVLQLGVPGVGHFDEPRRVYPHGQLAAHVLGFVGTDAQGLAGLERRFDKEIRGQSLLVAVDRDARGREFLRTGMADAPTQGARVELTLDSEIQALTERELAAGVSGAKAAAGAAVVLDPMTGEVLALANYPTFNPNDRTDWANPRHKDRMRNRVLTDPYEPGSTFKAVLAAGALEAGLVKPTERFFCENGAWRVGKWTVHDSHPHGWLSFAEVIQFSSNIGAAKVGDRLGRERYGSWLHSFGFGGRTGVELPDESPGIMRDEKSWARIDLLTQSFGQGISVTPMQMAVAYAAIANGGQLMRPFIVRRITGPNGDVTLEHEPTAIRRVMSQRTAQITTELLRRVVEEKGGTGSRARLDDFTVAGKTGTAQKVDPRTRAYSSKRIGSFVGFVPADHPRAVILVLIDEPATSSYGGVVAAPVFRNIASSVMQALHVTPERAPGPAPDVTRAQQAKAKGKAPAAKEKLARAEPPKPQVAAVPPADDAAAVPGTPSYLGLSLREALTRAHAAGWTVAVRGTGWVTEQYPTPGAPLGDDRRIALELRQDRPSAQP